MRPWLSLPEVFGWAGDWTVAVEWRHYSSTAELPAAEREAISRKMVEWQGCRDSDSWLQELGRSPGGSRSSTGGLRRRKLSRPVRSDILSRNTMLISPHLNIPLTLGVLCLRHGPRANISSNSTSSHLTSDWRPVFASLTTQAARLRKLPGWCFRGPLGPEAAEAGRWMVAAMVRGGGLWTEGLFRVPGQVRSHLLLLLLCRTTESISPPAPPAPGNSIAIAHSTSADVVARAG